MIPLTMSNFALISVVVGRAVHDRSDCSLRSRWRRCRSSTSPHDVSPTRSTRPCSAVQQEQAQLATVVEETVSGVRVIKGFGAEQVQADKLEVEADDIQRESLDAARVRATYLPFIDLLPAAGLIAVLGGRWASRARTASSRSASWWRSTSTSSCSCGRCARSA